MGRWAHAQGTGETISPDKKLRVCKAQHAFLSLGSSVVDWGEEDAMVPHFPDSNLRRHAEHRNNRRAQRGESPDFPLALQTMLLKLAHGGARSYTREGMVSVETTTGRCSCFDSVYGGVLRAIRWCKHKHYLDLCEECSARLRQDMRRHHVTLPGYFGHYQDLGISSLRCTIMSAN